MSDPSELTFLLLEGSGRFTVSAVNSSISAKSGKTSPKEMSGGSRSMDDTCGFCFMPGIFSISWVNTVEELDVSGLNISSGTNSGRLLVLSDATACFLASVSTCKLLEGFLVSVEIAGVDVASCLGTRLKGSRHGAMIGGTTVSRLQVIPVEGTG